MQYEFEALIAGIYILDRFRQEARGDSFAAEKKPAWEAESSMLSRIADTYPGQDEDAVSLKAGG